MSKYSKEEQEKFKRDLEEINLDSESDLEDSFYAKEMTRMQQELQSIKNAKKDLHILDELKKNIEKEDEMITEYEQEITELQRITKNEEKNVIDDTILNQIKIKVAQSNNNSILQLADEEYNQSLLKQSLIEQASQPKNFMKKTAFAEEIQKEELAIQKKIENANIEREHLAMEQEDKRSMKYEMECLSNLFSERFLRPKLKKLVQKDSKIQLISTKLRNTFTNLAPQIVNEANVLPKNSPEIALKQLKQSKRPSLKSISQTNAKVTSKKIVHNPQAFEDVPLNDKTQKDKNKEILQKQFLQYISFITRLLPPLEEISKSYSPKFLKFLEEKQKNINYDINEEKQVNKKEKHLMQVASLENAKDLKELKLTLQSITSLKGIEHFLNIEDAQLQFNALNAIQPIANCTKLLQLNLSHNKIKDISSIASLPWLRLLNIDHNLVWDLKLNCASLEILWASHNLIEDLDINSSKYLRVLLLNNNKINELPKLKLYNLEELNLSKNQLKSLKNLDELILLKKLNFSNNRLESIDEKLIYLYLNELNLSHNYITKLNLLFLPCLEHLYLNNNRIQSRSLFELYLPNLKELNLDENRLEGFSPIWQLLLYSRKMQYIRYSNNEYFLNLREKTREIYEYIIYKYMQNIKIINQNYLDIGIKKYYESNYEIYYHNIVLFKSNHNLIKYLENSINFILREFTFAGQLEHDRSSFIKEKEYIYYQSVQKIKQIKLIVNFIQQYSQQNNSMLSVSSSLFCHHDQFEIRKRHFYHMVRGIVIRYRYRKQRKLKYYLAIKPQVQMKLNQLLELFFRSQRFKAVSKFKHLLKGLNDNQAAIKIQKVWRGYIRRKLYKKLRSMKKKPDSDSDFEDVDTDFFNQQLQRHEFNLQNIEGVNFEDVIIRPEVFEYLQNKHKDEAAKNVKNREEKVAKEEKNLLVNNFLESQTKLKNKKEGKPTQEETMIKQWGIKDEKLLKTLQYKQQKRLDARKKEQDKLLTASQRYQRFKRGGH